MLITKKEREDLRRERDELIKLVEEYQNSFRASKEENKKLTSDLEEQRERYRLEVMNNSLEWNKYARSILPCNAVALIKKQMKQ